MAIVGMATLRMRHEATGREVEFHWHPNVAGQMRLHYEKKGWVVVADAPTPEPSPEPERPRRGRHPKDETAE